MQAILELRNAETQVMFELKNARMQYMLQLESCCMVILESPILIMPYAYYTNIHEA